MSTTFKAILLQSIQYTDRLGVSRVLPVGLPIDVSRVIDPHLSSNLEGKQNLEAAGTLYGSVGDDSFDVKPNEIRPLYN